MLVCASTHATGANILYNGDFSTVTSPWVVSVSGGAVASLTSNAGQGKIDIVTAGAAKTDIQVQQGLFADLVAGTPQVISFTARSASGRTIDVVVHDSGGGVLWSQTGISTGVSAASYSYAFTPSATHTKAYLAFHIGGSLADVWLDNVSLAPSDKLTWALPVLDNPVSINLGATNNMPVLSAGQDYLVTLPSVTRTKRVQIQGGRNVVIVGGAVDISAPDNAFYILEGDAGRVVHIEGCLVTQSGLGEGDAFGINAPTSIVQIENVRVEHLHGAAADLHADVIQPWGGTLDLRVDHLSGSSNYQGFFLIANYNKNTAFTFKNVNLVIEPEWYAGASGGDVIWLDRGRSGSMGGPVPTVFANFHAEVRSGDTLPNAVSPGSNATSPDSPPTLLNGFLSWPALAYVTGGIYDGPPPGGDYVPAGTAGLGYVTPGYVDRVWEVETIAGVTASDAVTVVNELAASGGAAGKLSSNAVGDYIAYILPDVPAGTYDVAVCVKKYSSRGQFQLSIDGIAQGGVQDQYAATNGYYEELPLGEKTFTSSGARVFTFTVTGKNASSPGYSLMFDTIKLTPRLPTIHFYEAESVTLAAASPSVSAVTESGASGGAAQKLNATAAGHYVRYTLASVPAGTYRVKVGIKTADSRGKFQLSVDGTNQGAEQDNYAVTAVYTELDLGLKTFATTGDRDFTFTVTGKNAASSGYGLVLDYIKLQ